MTPFDLYTLADWLIKNKPCPEGFRTSASRAYYGAFHTALRFLEEMGIAIPSGKNKHEVVPDILAFAADAAIVEAGAKLHGLRGERNRADYDLTDPDAQTQGFAELRLAECAQIIGVINTCRQGRHTPGTRYHAVKAAVQRWAQLLFMGPTASGR